MKMLKKTESVDINLSNIKKNVIADERFTANIVDYTIVAKRLKYLFTDAKILIVVRNQKEQLRSRYDMRPYNYFSKTKIWLNLDDWIDSYNDNIRQSFLDALFYDKVIDLYSEDFKKDNIKVCVFEELIQNNEDVLNDFLSFLGLENTELAKESLKSKSTNRAANHFLYHLKLKFFPGVSISKLVSRRMLLNISKYFSIGEKTKSTKYIEQVVDNIFRDSNLRLSNMLGKDLSNYNYL